MHELPHRTCLREGRQVALKFPEDYFDHVFSHMRPGYVVFGQGIPNFGALLCAADVSICLPPDFVEDGGVDGVERVERFGVELDGGEGVAAVGPDFGHGEVINIEMEMIILLYSH